MSGSCPICTALSEPFGSAVVMDRHEATYERCSRCGAVFIPKAGWLAEAYRESIALTDVGLVARNLELANLTTLLFRLSLRYARRFLDFGAGNGLYVRLMRDAGFDFRYFDAYGPNLFARGFEASPDEASRFDVVTVFELLEHLPTPIEALSPIFERSDVVVATTQVLPEPTPKPGEWWYYALETGQHVTFYTERSLDCVAAQLGKVRTSSGNLHVFAPSRMRRQLLRLYQRSMPARVLAPLARRRSLVDADYEAVKGDAAG